VELDGDEPVWNHAVFRNNREGRLNQEVARRFFDRVLKQTQPYRSDEPFPVDGTFLEAWASQKSFQKKDGGDAEGGSVFLMSAAAFHLWRIPKLTAAEA
jgi:hypothetical protein